VNGEPIGQAVPNSTITLVVSAGDNILCTKDNVDVTGTGLDPVVEPALNQRVYLPVITR
jgi:hypothetical protein